MPILAQESQNQHIYTVSELIDSVNQSLLAGFGTVLLKGEVSNFKISNGGHFYFSLKEENAKLEAVMFKGFNQRLKFKLEEGLKVIVQGQLEMYAPWGKFQIKVFAVQPEGIGELQLAFEQLKKKLADEGLFAAARKRPLPPFPQDIGVVTSPTGAAIHDIIHVLHKRFPPVNILLYPVKVQGDGAAEEIATGLNYFSVNKNVDMVIVGRGGGSLEELWAFNEEIVARAIALCSVPVISAVGHETDFSISDFVADRRAPTPSAAAEMAVPNGKDVLRQFHFLKERLSSHSERKIADLGKDIREYTRRLSQATHHLRERFLYLKTALLHHVRLNLQNLASQVEKYTLSLKLMDPKNTLKRGYVMATSLKGEVITRKKGIDINDKVGLTFYDGRVLTKVLEIEK